MLILIFQALNVWSETLKVDGDHDVPASELFTDDFMRRNTQFQTFQAMLDAGGIKDKEEIGSEAFDAVIAAQPIFGLARYV